MAIGEYIPVDFSRNLYLKRGYYRPGSGGLYYWEYGPDWQIYYRTNTGDEMGVNNYNVAQTVSPEFEFGFLTTGNSFFK